MSGKYQMFNLYPEGSAVTPANFQDMEDAFTEGEREEIVMSPGTDGSNTHDMFAHVPSQTLWLPKRSRFIQRWMRHKTGAETEDREGRLVRIPGPVLLGALLSDVRKCLHPLGGVTYHHCTIPARSRLAMRKVNCHFPLWTQDTSLGGPSGQDLADMHEALPVLEQAAAWKGVSLYFESHV
jgi:hypothetical protein